MTDPGENAGPGGAAAPHETGSPAGDAAPQPHAGPIPCASCNYDLRGVRLGEACPECGTTVSQFPVSDRSSGHAVASLVLGILSVTTCVYYGLPGLICGILAMSYAKKARLAVQGASAPAMSLSMAKAGRVCGLIGLILSAVFLGFMVLYMIFIVGVVGAAAWGGGFSPSPVPGPLPSPTPMPTP